MIFNTLGAFLSFFICAPVRAFTVFKFRLGIRCSRSPPIPRTPLYRKLFVIDFCPNQPHFCLANLGYHNLNRICSVE
ncbi:hypothetical protein QBC45DRAFT_419364 [Copromyces sp. CBS 386.78]|nr:hypothetical protein QBC45DRAFT_419364 [Copromyces sp. CBS 386.78]